MMMQYLEIKEQNKDAIVMFRLGDFYEMFFEDAKIASKVLDIALTGRDAGAKRKSTYVRCSFSCCFFIYSKTH